MIGDEVEIFVLDIKGDQIKLGVKAPLSLTVHRSEVYQDIKNQNKEAAASTPQSLQSLGKLFQKKKK